MTELERDLRARATAASAGHPSRGLSAAVAISKMRGEASKGCQGIRSSIRPGTKVHLVVSDGQERSQTWKQSPPVPGVSMLQWDSPAVSHPD
jgi:hypothetical protein